MISRLLVLALIVGGFAVALLYSQRQTGPYKVSGVVEADEIRVGSRVGGRVKAVQAAEGSRVKAGDVLVTLEAFDLPDRRAEADARCRQLEAQLQKLEKGPRPQEVEAARDRLAAAKAQAELAKLTFDRTKKLVAENNASVDQLDRATNDLKAAEANANAQEQEVGLLVEGSRKEDIAAARASLEATRAALAIIDRQMEELSVRTPVDGIVEALDLQPGDLVASNAPVLSIMDTRAMWIRAYVPEGRLQLEVGQPLKVTLDAFPGETLKGRLTFVARQGEFTPGNVQTPEERSKQVFRIKVALEGPTERLRPGMAGDVWLEEAK
ncbi:MAG: efflux RND transporter periplasmic adaptor subunit [Planctomycetota bacterium]